MEMAATPGSISATFPFTLSFGHFLYHNQESLDLSYSAIVTRPLSLNLLSVIIDIILKDFIFIVYFIFFWSNVA